MKALEFDGIENNFYILKGGDLYLRDRAENVFFSSVQNDAVMLNFRRFDGEYSLFEVVEYMMLAPQFCDKRVAVCREASRPFTVAETDAFLSYLSVAPKDRVLAVCDSAGRFGFASKRATEIDCSPLPTVQLVPIIISMAAEQNLRVEFKAAAAIAEYCACDLARISVEIKKLADYGDWKVDEKLVEEMVPADAEISVFRLSDAVARGENDAALKLLKTMLARGDSPASLLGLLLNKYRRIFLFSISDAKEDELSSLYNIKKSAIYYDKRDAAAYGAVQMKYIVETLENYEYKLKSGAIRPEAAIYEAVGKILASGRRN